MKMTTELEGGKDLNASGSRVKLGELLALVPLQTVRGPRDEEEVVRFAKVWPQTGRILPAEATGATAAVRDASWTKPAGAFAPEVLGLSARDALARFVASGLVPEMAGTGFVMEQNPAAGLLLEPGFEARLILGPMPPDAPGPSAPSAPPREAPGAIRVAGDSRPAFAPGASARLAEARVGGRRFER